MSPWSAFLKFCVEEIYPYIICCFRNNEMITKRPRKAKRSVLYTEHCDESSDLEGISDYTSSGDEWGPTEVDSHKKTRGKPSKTASVRVEFRDRSPKWAPNSLGLLPSLRTWGNTLTSPRPTRFMPRSQKVLRSTQSQDVPSIAILNATSPSVQTPGMNSPHPQSLNMTSSHPRPLNVTSPYHQARNATLPHTQYVNMTSRYPKSISVSPPHPQSTNVTSPQPRSLNMTIPYPLPHTVTSPTTHSLTVTSPYTKATNVTSQHTQSVNVNSLQPQSLDMTSPYPLSHDVTHTQCLNVTSPYPHSPNVTSPLPHSPNVIPPSPQTLNMDSPYPQIPNITSPHPQSPNVTSPSPPPLDATSLSTQSLDVTSPSQKCVDMTWQSSQQSGEPFSPHVSAQLVLRSQRLPSSTPTPDELVEEKENTDNASNVKSEINASRQSDDHSTSGEYRDTVGSDATLAQPTRHSDIDGVVVEFRLRHGELLREMVCSGEPKQCPLCRGVFRRKDTLLKHVKKYHEDLTWGIRCKECQAICDTIKALGRHMRYKIKKSNSQNVPQYKCKVCSKSSMSASLLKIHMESHNEKNLKCDECDRYFSGPRRLKVHQYKVHSEPGPERHFKCSYCCRTFNKRYVFVNHLKRHLNEKECLCDVCGKAFHDKHRLRVHKRMHSEEKEFACGVCAKRFRQPNALHTHMRVHTGKRPYKCLVCDKAFKTSTHLNNHTRVHTGERPYKCSLCDKSFITIGNRINHMKTHGS